MVQICRKEHFNAAHKLYNPKWTKEENEAFFGPCANENWHGHNFEMTVIVEGEPDPDTGYVMNMKHLGKLVKEHIINKVDHKNLNMDVDFLEGKMTSCETLVMEFWKILAPKIEEIAPNAHLHCIELWETNKNFVRYFG
ncbi:6-pyruvoyl trahydropterin synthase family protein [Sediminitomix flava]|uniref:6-carboxy-5,6,7,8-tetrahydropterin synthase n=1 Tax=Sediminitomix flava TaxID=379075 RepID=A0A315ZB31_SEDFL|nr:6-carboxytetrahydropterin synthase [Sediminitomix flava]PWJ42028.1 6-pyruvoyltetrahydropterin/6-carboxytetrahydropterin synthase [Sediminitomix flava]